MKVVSAVGIYKSCGCLVEGGPDLFGLCFLEEMQAVLTAVKLSYWRHCQARSGQVTVRPGKRNV